MFSTHLSDHLHQFTFTQGVSSLILSRHPAPNFDVVSPSLILRRLFYNSAAFYLINQLD